MKWSKQNLQDVAEKQATQTTRQVAEFATCRKSNPTIHNGMSAT